MMSFRCVRGGLPLAVALLVACGTPSMPPAPKPAPLPVASPGARSVAVSEADAGASVTVEMGQDLIVTLPTVVVTPFEWSIVELKPGVLLPTGSKFEQLIRNVDPGDSPAVQHWRFRPEAPGRVTLHFDLRRPRSLTPAQQSVVYDVTVK